MSVHNLKQAKAPEGYFDIGARDNIRSIENGTFMINALKEGLIHTYLHMLFNGPAGMAYHLLNQYEHEKMGEFVNQQQIGFLTENNILFGVAALDKLRPAVAQFLGRVEEVKSHLQGLSAQMLMTYCQHAIDFHQQNTELFWEESPKKRGRKSYSEPVKEPVNFVEGAMALNFEEEFCLRAIRDVYQCDLFGKLRALMHPDSQAENAKYPDVTDPDNAIFAGLLNDISPSREDVSVLYSENRDQCFDRIEKLTHGLSVASMMERILSTYARAPLLTVLAHHLMNGSVLALWETTAWQVFEATDDMVLEDPEGEKLEISLMHMTVDQMTKLLKNHYHAANYISWSGSIFKDVLDDSHVKAVLETEFSKEEQNIVPCNLL